MIVGLRAPTSFHRGRDQRRGFSTHCSWIMWGLPGACAYLDSRGLSHPNCSRNSIILSSHDSVVRLPPSCPRELDVSPLMKYKFIKSLLGRIRRFSSSCCRVHGVLPPTQPLFLRLLSTGHLSHLTPPRFLNYLPGPLGSRTLVEHPPLVF
ncbi:hypothetical protein BJX68DRAFT_248949 [Aspergillus pseudodeflectus]|uniref:Uncharacterized protein n=1 Tax=Aspergillus pseudodeflectus TaxID=176178 RepID=A0ABR4JEC3_9EURO